MKTPTPAPALLGAPYHPPRLRKGKALFDALRGDVRVVDTSEAPIPWPRGRTHYRSRPMPVMSDELVRAVRTESVEAIAYHWGVSRYSVRRWRHALGVPRFNPGTQRLWRELAPLKLTPKVRKKALRAYLAWCARRREAAP